MPPTPWMTPLTVAEDAGADNGPVLGNDTVADGGVLDIVDTTNGSEGQ